MKKALAGVLAAALIGLLAGSAIAQVPYVQVYFDPAHTQTQADCPGTPPFIGPPVELYVVAVGFNMLFSGFDLSISYPPSMLWLADVLADPETQVAVGNSPLGLAVATANCCPWNGFSPVEVFRPLVLWGECDCHVTGPQPLVVGGYTPLAKTQPTVVRKSDFQEFPGVGMTSLICPGVIATEQSTWGQVKALYR